MLHACRLKTLLEAAINVVQLPRIKYAFGRDLYLVVNLFRSIFEFHKITFMLKK